MICWPYAFMKYRFLILDFLAFWWVWSCCSSELSHDTQYQVTSPRAPTREIDLPNLQDNSDIFVRIKKAQNEICLSDCALKEMAIYVLVAWKNIILQIYQKLSVAQTWPSGSEERFICPGACHWYIDQWQAQGQRNQIWQGISLGLGIFKENSTTNYDWSPLSLLYPRSHWRPLLVISLHDKNWKKP